MSQPVTDEQTEAANEQEREQWGIDQAAWDAAFAWADEPAATATAHTSTPSRADGAFAVWPCNWATSQLFLHCQTQWTEDAMGKLKGLNYPGVQCVLAARCPGKRQRVREFKRLQAMEFAALAEVHRGQH